MCNITNIIPPVRRKIIRKKKTKLEQSEKLEKPIVDIDNVEECVLVKAWKCSSNDIHYLLDPITQEVFDKLTHGFIGFRYKDEDEVSLIDYS